MYCQCQNLAQISTSEEDWQNFGQSILQKFRNELVIQMIVWLQPVSGVP